MVGNGRTNSRDKAKREALKAAISELDRLNQQPYQEITNGKVVNGQLQGGEEKERRGAPNWHESDARRAMLLRHNYQQGVWSQDLDRPRLRPEGRVPLAASLSAEVLFDLANFVAAHEGEAQVIEDLRDQGFRLLVSGEETKELETDGIAAKFSIIGQNKAHREGRHFWYISEDGGIQVKYAPRTMVVAK